MRQRAGICTSPCSAEISPAITPNSVVLPVPLRPTRPTRAPVGTRAEALSKSMRPPMRTVRSSITSMARLLAERSGQCKRSGDDARAAEAALPLKDDQIEARRLVVADNRGQQRMRLSAMVCLVIEEMIERGLKLLLDRLRIDESAEAERSGELIIAERSDVVRDTLILRAPRRA